MSQAAGSRPGIGQKHTACTKGPGPLVFDCGKNDGAEVASSRSEKRRSAAAERLPTFAADCRKALALFRPT